MMKNVFLFPNLTQPSSTEELLPGYVPHSFNTYINRDFLVSEFKIEIIAPLVSKGRKHMNITCDTVIERCIWRPIETILNRPRPPFTISAT